MRRRRRYAEDDEKVNAMREDYKKALTQNKIQFEMHTYPNTKHGFHNNSTPRYNKEAAEMACTRTLEIFKTNLRS
ncbi:MAG: hypothetical protein Fur0010_23700 [Bdellovibrio sp.]